MKRRMISPEIIARFRKHLAEEEKSDATIEKYIRDVKAFIDYMNTTTPAGDVSNTTTPAGAVSNTTTPAGVVSNTTTTAGVVSNTTTPTDVAFSLSRKMPAARQQTTLSKEQVIAYKQHLLDRGYAIASINSMIASLNSLFRYMGWGELKVKALRVQQKIFCSEEKELTRAEYERLCRAAQRRSNQRLCLILQTLCSTGIRVSELPFITVEAVRNGKVEVSLKGKTRSVFLVYDLQKKLQRYIISQKIETGSVFITRTGRPMSRTNIWREMKNLCEEAGVDSPKVFPHNLRHLFARAFYSIEKDIAKLADVLGHSSVNTTRIYIISTGQQHRRYMEQLHLLI